MSGLERIDLKMQQYLQYTRYPQRGRERRDSIESWLRQSLTSQSKQTQSNLSLRAVIPQDFPTLEQRGGTGPVLSATASFTTQQDTARGGAGLKSLLTGLFMNLCFSGHNALLYFCTSCLSNLSFLGICTCGQLDL